METMIPQRKYVIQRFNGFWEEIASSTDEEEAYNAYQTLCKAPRSADIHYRLVQPYFRLISQTGGSDGLY